jgi:uncharacterized membrane protein YfcA
LSQVHPDIRGRRIWGLVGIGLGAGLMSGLLGVGGGIVVIPLLVQVGFTQHQAHATSLAAICPIAAVGAAKFGAAGEVEVALAIALSAGALIGAPLGARVMAGLPEPKLKVVFGAVMVVAGVVLLWP